jgi:3-hydroxyisobutyrate dehydrogenase
MTMKMKVGFVGVGDMGGPMVLNLLKAGFEVIAHDRNADCQAAVVDAGAEAASSAREVADRAELVMVCLDKEEAMREVAKACAKGNAVKIYADLSTSGPTMAKALREQFASAQTAMLDAPVSGYISQAVDGTLTVMVSGHKQAFERAEPAFNAIGKHVFWLGDLPGGGQMMKVANNYVNNVQTLGTSEAIVMGMQFGLKPEDMFKVMNVSTGRNSQTEGQLRDAVTKRDFCLGAKISISLKDMTVATKEAQRLEVPATTGEAARAALQGAVETGGNKQRSSAVFKYVAARAGVKLE